LYSSGRGGKQHFLEVGNSERFGQAQHSGGVRGKSRKYKTIELDSTGIEARELIEMIKEPALKPQLGVLFG
jgi:hypothetical protein